MAFKGKRIKIDYLDSSKTIVDSSINSWLDQLISEWPEGLIIPVGRGIYAKPMIILGESKVTFGSYSDGSLTSDEIDMYWIRSKHPTGAQPPTGTTLSPVRLDVFVTITLPETQEMLKLLMADDNKSAQEEFFLSSDTSSPFKRGRILIKNGREFKLAKAGMYELGGASVRSYDMVALGSDLQQLRKLTNGLVKRLTWLEEHRRYAGSDASRNSEEVQLFLKQRSKALVAQNVLSTVDSDPVKWANKREAEWSNLSKEQYRQIDKSAVIMEMLNADALSKRMAELTLGEVREIITKSLASPEHVSSVIEDLFERGSVLSEKRKILVEKHNKRKRKAQSEIQPEECASSQDIL